MIGDNCNNPLFFWYYRILWKFVIPPILIALIIISWVQYTPLKTDDYVFPFYVTTQNLFFNFKIFVDKFG